MSERQHDIALEEQQTSDLLPGDETAEALDEPSTIEPNAERVRADVMRCIACIAFQQGPAPKHTIETNVIRACTYHENAVINEQVRVLAKQGLVEVMSPKTRNTANVRLVVAATFADVMQFHERPDVCNVALTPEVIERVNTKSSEKADRIELELARVRRIIHKFYPEEHERAKEGVRFLLCHDILSVANIHDQPTNTLEQRSRTRAIQNRTFDQQSLYYLGFGPKITGFSEPQLQAILHVIGADVLVLGTRLRPGTLLSMLKLPETTSLAQYVQVLLSKL